MALSKAMTCAIYARFSSEMQSPRSIDDQVRECREYAERQGWEVVLVEKDAAVRAGASAGRLGYHRLLRAAREGSFQVLLFEEVSRFSRDFLEGLHELGALHAMGVRVADTKTGMMDLDSMAGQLQAAVSFAQSQAETKRLGERSKRGLRGQTEKKFSSGGRPAFGLRREPVFSETEADVDGRPVRVGVRFVPDPVTAPVVRRVFEMFDAGVTKRAIAHTLNREGVPTRDAGRVYDGRVNTGTWAAASIKRILENTIYIGVRRWNEHSRTGPKLPQSGKKALRRNQTGVITVRDFVEPIIERELWDRVQRRVAEVHKEYEKRGIARPGRGYLLSGLIICSSCGGRFVAGAKVREEPHYRCGFRAARGASLCTNATSVSRPGLERKVRYVLDAIAKDPKELEVLVAEHNQRVNNLNEEQRSTVQALEHRKKEVEAGRRRLVEAVKAGGQDIGILVAELKQSEAEVAKLHGQIAAAEAEIQPLLLPNVKTVDDFVVGRDSIFDGDDAHDREFLNRVIEGIFVYQDGTVVMRFKEDSLFAPVRGYEFHPDRMWERGVQGDRWLQAMHEDFTAKLARTMPEAELRVVEQKGGLRFRLSALRSPPLHNVSVPTGI
ncbi:MAG: recombinase family protein [Myxococcales bacterium]|nr:recombinase family protein [Myxococcales bacterium]